MHSLNAVWVRESTGDIANHGLKGLNCTTKFVPRYRKFIAECPLDIFARYLRTPNVLCRGSKGPAARNWLVSRKGHVRYVFLSPRGLKVFRRTRWSGIVTSDTHRNAVNMELRIGAAP